MSPRQRLTLVLALTVLAGAVLVVGGVAVYVVRAFGKTTRDITYEVTGTARELRISYVQGENPYNLQKADGARLPWSKSLHVKAMTAHAVVVATTATGETGTVACTLRVDGKVIATQQATGGDRTVSCAESD